MSDGKQTDLFTDLE